MKQPTHAELRSRIHRLAEDTAENADDFWDLVDREIIGPFDIMVELPEEAGGGARELGFVDRLITNSILIGDYRAAYELACNARDAIRNCLFTSSWAHNEAMNQYCQDHEDPGPDDFNS